MAAALRSPGLVRRTPLQQVWLTFFFASAPSINNVRFTAVDRKSFDCQVETESAVKPTHQKRKKQRQLQKHVKPERPQNMQMRPSLSYKWPKPQANPQEDNEKAKAVWRKQNHDQN